MRLDEGPSPPLVEQKLSRLDGKQGAGVNRVGLCKSLQPHRGVQLTLVFFSADMYGNLRHHP